ncbi:hypothetical protein [Sphingomonas pokkalii]|uniref:Uncharacterized protein n=1 Tax=Sphingomonas pokkalii TaxID=2175090 RepID=A0A2U0SHP8_9SPHN|nr:hypothetical protein [Sphingomonas pokkalii]PVX30865.1 hypothetical protein DD559_17295 [Sphingomonas pokkalii]
MIAIAIFWALYAIAAFAPMRYCVWFFFVSVSFSAFAVLPTSMTASLTILPTSMLVPLIVAKALLSVKRSALLWDALFNLNQIGMLTVFLLVALAVTALAPSLFAGVPIVSMNQLAIRPLAYESAHLSQSVYLLASFLLVVAIHCILLTDSGRRYVAEGLLIGGAVAVFSGVADMALANTPLLEMLRTADYAFLSDSAAAGTRRVVGFGSEASVFGGLTLGFLGLIYFVRPAALLPAWAEPVQAGIIAALFCFVCLSTSSSAIVGLLIGLAIATVDYFGRLASPGFAKRRGGLLFEGWIAAGAVILVVLLLAAIAPLRDAVFAIFEQMVLKKTQSDSFEERSGWSAASLEGLAHSYGFGVGLGGTRASSWAVSVVASTGVVGGLLLFLFIAGRMLAVFPADGSPEWLMARGAKRAMVTLAAPMLLASTTPDFGPLLAVDFALLTALPLILWNRRAAIAPSPRGSRAAQRPLPSGS